MSNIQAERILDGAWDLFSQAGIRSVTMDDIARHLGMSKKTIYQSFSDKDEIVNALVSKKLAEDKESMCGIGERSTNAMDEIIAMMKCFEEFASKINPVVIHDMQKYYPETWKMMQQFKGEFVVNYFQDILNRGIEQGYIRPEIDARIMARIHVIQVEAGFNAAFFPPSEYNIWKVQLQFLEHFLFGICTAKGYEILAGYKKLIEQD